MCGGLTFNKGQKCCTGRGGGEKKSEKVVVREKGGGGGIPCAEADILLQHVEDPMTGAYFHIAVHGGPNIGSVGFLMELLPVDNARWSRFFS